MTEPPHPEPRALRIAAVIPCYNEALAIAQVIEEFRSVLPEAEIHVFDNNSTDDTAAVARAHGAQVTHVALRGKGNVARRMFADVEADVYVMTDGDATYDLGEVRRLIDLLVDGNLDMVVGSRVDAGDDANTYRRGHRFGNRLLTGAVASLFGGHLKDMLSGYRVFSRRYAKSFPAVSKGFEIETELTVHALELRMPFAEVPGPYRSRPEGSQSKLSTYRDGWRILRTIFKLFMSERPLLFFSGAAAVLALVSLVLAEPLIVTYLRTGLVPRLPTAVLATGTMLMAMLSFVCGIVLHTVTIGRQEAKRLRYLAIPGVRSVVRPRGHPMRIGREFLSFTAVGAIGFVVDVGVLYLASPHLGWYGGRVLSWLAAATATWVLNRRFTFGTRPSGHSIAREYAHYLLTMVGGALVNYAAYVLTLHAVGPASWAPALGVAIGSGAGLVVNFLAARYLVFRAARKH